MGRSRAGPSKWRAGACRFAADWVTLPVVDAGAGVDLTKLNLDVYDTRDGPWNPEHGELTIPDDWELLPAGDPFVTRRVKAAGRYWLAYRPRGRNRPHRRLIGVWAPTATIKAAFDAAEATADRRGRQRVQGEASRNQKEAHYREEFAAAIVRYLNFAPDHQPLAEEIAEETAAHAALVGSGRVGRTRTLSLDERAALAARAHIRHRHTDYEDQLGELTLQDADYLYGDVKADALEAVDAFLDAHRTTE
jgi:hypothetical protein